MALDEVRKMYAGTGTEPPSELLEYAEIVLTVCIMSIVITAPVGAIVITIAGPRLLSKTTKPPVMEGKLTYLLDIILRYICTTLYDYTSKLY